MEKRYSNLRAKYDRRYGKRPKAEVKETVVKRLTLEKWALIEKLRRDNKSRTHDDKQRTTTTRNNATNLR